MAHPLKFGLFFLCMSGTLLADNDKGPVQNDKLPAHNGQRVWNGPVCGPEGFNQLPPFDGGFDGNYGPGYYAQGPYFDGGQGPYFDGGPGVPFDSCNPCCYNACSSDNWAVRVEGLYWKVSEDNLDYCYKTHFKESIGFTTPITADGARAVEGTANAAGVGQLPPPPDSIVFIKEHIKKKCFDFKWRPGIRLGLAYASPCTCWDLAFGWTHFRNHTSSSEESTGFLNPPTTTTASIREDSLKPAFFPPCFSDPCDEFNHCEADWHVKFDNFELNFGHRCNCDCCFGFRPYIGLKYVNIVQKLDIESKVFRNPFDPDDFGKFDQEFKTRYSAFGFQGGLAADWCLGCGFVLYSNVSGGIVHGRAHTREHFHQQFTFFPGEDESFVNDFKKFKHHCHVTRPNVDFALGFQWQNCFCNCYHVTLRAGWEYHHYFGQNFFRYAQDHDPARGDLAMHGLTFGGDISF